MDRTEEVLNTAIKNITQEELNALIGNRAVIDITADKIIDMMDKTDKQSDLGDYIKSIIPGLQAQWDYFGELDQYSKMTEEAKEYIESGADEEIVDMVMVGLKHIIARGLLPLFKYKYNRTNTRIKDKYYEVVK
ncbi:MAG: hypothetical protein GY804_14940 [Alphaproteobacteria bacterium]|nr:hypothetical protein [Alphaproteobacteria bacterium]